MSLISSYDSQHRAIHNNLSWELLELLPPSSKPQLLMLSILELCLCLSHVRYSPTAVHELDSLHLLQWLI